MCNTKRCSLEGLIARSPVLKETGLRPSSSSSRLQSISERFASEHAIKNWSELPKKEHFADCELNRRCEQNAKVQCSLSICPRCFSYSCMATFVNDSVYVLWHQPDSSDRKTLEPSSSLQF